MFPRGKQKIKKKEVNHTMSTNEIFAAVLSQFPGAAMVRKSKQTFIAVPMGENEDGVMEYAKVAVSALLSKATKTNPAFDFDAAVAEYEAYAAEQAAKAAKPKAERKSGADPEKVAAREARQKAMLAWLIANPGEHTSSQIKDGMPEVYGDQTIMTVGSDAKGLWESGEINRREEKSKKFYFFG